MKHMFVGQGSSAEQAVQSEGREQRIDFHSWDYSDGLINSKIKNNEKENAHAASACGTSL